MVPIFFRETLELPYFAELLVANFAEFAVCAFGLPAGQLGITYYTTGNVSVALYYYCRLL